MRYERPGIVRREPIAGLLTKQMSDVQPDGAISDVHVKDNIVPVVWAEPRSVYATPAIVRRDSIAGMLGSAPPSDPKADFDSDVDIKDNIVPVRW